MPLKVLFISGTRADWGLLSPLAHELRRRGNNVGVVSTNTEGNLGASEAIEKEGFTLQKIETRGSRTDVAATTLAQLGEMLRSDTPDLVVILGDRFEMLGAASAALLTGVPVCHIAGGTISEGAMDDSIRHAITKMSTLHLVETERCRERIIQMGENPENVICTGAIGVWSILNMPLMPKEDLEASLNFHIDKPLIIATLHAATNSQGSPREEMKAMLDALGETLGERGGSLILTYPNNDVDPTEQIALMQQFAAELPRQVLLIPSLGHLRYLSALACADCVVGNSSSGIVEVPSMGIPTVNIGIRQKGRERAQSVIDCQPNKESIYNAISLALSAGKRAEAEKRENPYSQPDTLCAMADAIEKHAWRKNSPKPFFSVSRTSDTSL